VTETENECEEPTVFAIEAGCCVNTGACGGGVVTVTAAGELVADPKEFEIVTV
jgi:hypothetical protein